MLGIGISKNSFTDAFMAVFDADDVRYSDRRHFFFISRPLLLNTRLLLTSVRNKKTIKWVSQTVYKLLFLFFLDCYARP